MSDYIRSSWKTLTTCDPRCSEKAYVLKFPRIPFWNVGGIPLSRINEAASISALLMVCQIGPSGLHARYMTSRPSASNAAAASLESTKCEFDYKKEYYTIITYPSPMGTTVTSRFGALPWAEKPAYALVLVWSEEDVSGTCMICDASSCDC